MSEAECNSRDYKILVGIDYSETSALALHAALDLARAHPRSHIHLIYVAAAAAPLGPSMLTPNGIPATAPSAGAADQQLRLAALGMQAYVAKILGSIDVQVAASPSTHTQWTAHVRLGDAARAIAQLAGDVKADIVVIGTHGRTGLTRFLLGSVAEGVVRRAPCPVLVMRALGASADQEPGIEPPCPRCVATRKATEGREFWCEQHQEHHERRHTYHFSPFRSAHQSGLLQPLPER